MVPSAFPKKFLARLSALLAVSPTSLGKRLTICLAISLTLLNGRLDTTLDK